MAAGTNRQDLLLLTPCCLPKQCGHRRTRSPQLGTWYVQAGRPRRSAAGQGKAEVAAARLGMQTGHHLPGLHGRGPLGAGSQKGTPTGEESVELGVGEKCSIRWGLGR